MYKSFFGFKERPFKLVPDPTYLFLSKSHEEALAHLSYAIRQGDGFVEITGEVGTGKTTLCRVFLENLSEDTEAAYIFNPKLDAIQLLKSINDEFHIDSALDNTKDLIDILNRFLLEKKAQDKRILLLIDEAQNLTMPVMEQIRLLSNLETTRSKLIQIILVGQPELGEMLDSHELRQLGQRITLRCHLRPLDMKETRDYILHRISIAAKKPGVHFTRGAFRAIYRYSGGIPRLINIICDRALLVAFGFNEKQITRKVANRALGELSVRPGNRPWEINWFKQASILLGACCLVLVALLFFRSGRQTLEPAHARDAKEVAATPAANPSSPQSPSPSQSMDAAPVAAQGSSPETSDPIPDLAPDLADRFARVLDQLSPKSRDEALEVVWNLWERPIEPHPFLESIENDIDFFQLAARQKGFMVRPVQGNLAHVEQLDLPAILEFGVPGGGSTRYMTLVRSDPANVGLRAGESASVTVDRETLRKFWSGNAYVPWRDFYHLTGTIATDASPESIVALKMLMRDIGYGHIQMTPTYDPATEAAVREIQAKNGLDVDGLVGSSTKIVLYNEVPGLKIPHILEKATSPPTSQDTTQQPAPQGVPHGGGAS